ncbi:hypothetical protein [Bombilactobacillus thymidiniphilus]|uniref:Uncharacterized protein n=1 Tax=Bombilactobacillus thymidiniphilus TaxID=2923363 RepID=A0ABY4PCM8_9LACO|nr:hypothetical protein [Bombilactobacillus thymidiniphilus]UQS83441.1 hypothetical protein MOO47_06620 [Bombilactobacillus thymidiniphilus]
MKLMDDTQWLLDQIRAQQKKAPQYEIRAFWQGLATLVEQQAKRNEQLEAEIDGRLWNHDQW